MSEPQQDTPDPSPVAKGPDRRRKRRSKAQHPGPQRPRRDSGRGSQHHATRAVQALSEMTQALFDVEGVDLLARPRFVDVHVKVPLGEGKERGRSAQAVVRQIVERVKEVREHEKALVPGHVYCYFSGRPDADASRPSEPRQVFEGYSSTGKPRFADFVTMAIERKDQDLDALLAGEDVIITHVSVGQVLRTQQLQEFGENSPIYHILGQVDAGLFPVLTGPHKAAFSFQLLRGTTLEGKPRLRLHPVSACDLLDVADPSVPQILSRFQRRLDEESLRLAGKHKNAPDGEVDEEEFVVPLLQELAKHLVGRARRRNRRTEHADERTRQGERPTTKAWADAKEAADDQLLMDDTEGTVVVLGPRGRVHVFSLGGKHVTSLVMQGAAIGKRRGQGRWRAAEPEERGEFRIKLQAREEESPPPVPVE